VGGHLTKQRAACFAAKKAAIILQSVGENEMITEARRAKNKRYYEKHREELLVKQKIYEAAHREELNADHKKWCAEHLDRVRIHSSNRRARIRGAGGTHTTEEFAALCAAFGNKCPCCGKAVLLTVDHVIPLSRGGTNGIENIQPLCGPCNNWKFNKIIDFRSSWEAT